MNIAISSRVSSNTNANTISRESESVVVCSGGCRNVMIADSAAHAAARRMEHMLVGKRSADDGRAAFRCLIFESHTQGQYERNKFFVASVRAPSSHRVTCATRRNLAARGIVGFVLCTTRVRYLSK